MRFGGQDARNSAGQSEAAVSVQSSGKKTAAGKLVQQFVRAIQSQHVRLFGTAERFAYPAKGDDAAAKHAPAAIDAYQNGPIPTLAPLLFWNLGDALGFRDGEDKNAAGAKSAMNAAKKPAQRRAGIARIEGVVQAFADGGDRVAGRSLSSRDATRKLAPGATRRAIRIIAEDWSTPHTA